MNHVRLSTGDQLEGSQKELLPHVQVVQQIVDEPISNKRKPSKSSWGVLSQLPTVDNITIGSELIAYLQRVRSKARIERV